MRLKKFIVVVIVLSLIIKTGFTIKENIVEKFMSVSTEDTEIEPTDESEDEETEENDENDENTDILDVASWSNEMDLFYSNPMSGRFFNGYGVEANTGETMANTFDVHNGMFETETTEAIYYLGEDHEYESIRFDIAVSSYSADLKSWGEVRIYVSQNGEDWKRVYSSGKLNELSKPLRNQKADIPKGAEYLKLEAITDVDFYFATDQFIIT